MFETLINYLYTDSDEQVRDIAGSGLKTMLDEVPDEQQNLMKTIVKKISPKIIAAVAVRVVALPFLPFSRKLLTWARVSFLH
jgi:hypothetical protein